MKFISQGKKIKEIDEAGDCIIFLEKYLKDNADCTITRESGKWVLREKTSSLKDKYHE
jgi:hypothetical protein